MAVTIADLAEFRLGRVAETGQDFEEAGLMILGGCQGCGASIAAYNAFASKTGFWRCRECVGELGFSTVEEANKELFEKADLLNCPECGCPPHKHRESIEIDRSFDSFAEDGTALFVGVVSDHDYEGGDNERLVCKNGHEWSIPDEASIEYV